MVQKTEKASMLQQYNAVAQIYSTVKLENCNKRFSVVVYTSSRISSIALETASCIVPSLDSTGLGLCWWWFIQRYRF